MIMSHIDGPSATGEISIPTSISHNGNNYAVTRIGKNAFISCGGLTGLLTIPNSVTYLGENAFLGCSILWLQRPDRLADHPQFGEGH